MGSNEYSGNELARAVSIGVLALVGLVVAAATVYTLTFCRLPLLGTPVDLRVSWAACAPALTEVAPPPTPIIPTAAPVKTHTVPATTPATAHTAEHTPLPLSTVTAVIAAPVPPMYTATGTVTPSPSWTATAAPTGTPVPSATTAATPTAARTATRTRLPTPVATLNQRGRVGLGAYELATPYDEFAAIQRFEVLVRHKMEYVLWFQAWGDTDREFSSRWVELATQRGLVPVITWEPWRRDFDNPAAFQPAYSLQSIAAGDHDDYIRSWARAAKRQGASLIIRFAHEQSVEPGRRFWYPWQGDPAAYKSAFRRIVQIFRDEGASQVQFLWSAMWLNEWAWEYYPGDDVVDYVGTTALNHGTAVTADWARWRTFDELFGGQYEAALQWNKPVIITELATAEQGGNKAAWLRDCLDSLQSKYPLVRGVLAFEVESDREWPDVNWSVASSPESLAAFRTSIADAHFR